VLRWGSRKRIGVRGRFQRQDGLGQGLRKAENWNEIDWKIGFGQHGGENSTPILNEDVLRKNVFCSEWEGSNNEVDYYEGG